MAALNLSKVLPARQVKDSVKLWLAEDMPNFDIAAVAITNDDKEGQLLVKETAVVAGLPFVNEVFTQLNCSVEWKVEEGTKVTNVPCCVAIIRGPVIQILRGERLALNIFSRSCGIATLAKKLMEITNTNKWKGSVVGTRKTTPGFRLVEKYAMLIGGAGAHRFDLSSMVMLKDNHIDASIVPDKEKAITQAVNQVRKLAGIHMKIEVESRNEKEALAGAAAGADIIMLDNFNARVACSVAQKIKARFPRVSIEASGNITETNIAGYMGSHIDIISTSRLCHGYTVIDASMKLQPSTTPPVTELSTAVAVTPDLKRPAPASDGKPAAKADTNKNGDSSAPVADIPEKRRKVEETNNQSTPATESVTAAATEVSADSESKAADTTSPQRPANSSTTPTMTIKSSPTSTAKPSPTSKPASQSNVSKTPGNRPNTANNGRPSGAAATPRPAAANARGGGSQNANANKTPNQGGRRPPLISKTTPPGGRMQRGNANQNQNRANQQGTRMQQQNQFNRNPDRRSNERFQGIVSSPSLQGHQSPQNSGRGLMSGAHGSAGPLHQQLALQAAASRASGMPIRPGGGMGGMMVRPGMASGPPMRGGFGGMGPSRANMTGPNAIPINGPRAFGMGGRPNNGREWEYGY